MLTFLVNLFCGIAFIGIGMFILSCIIANYVVSHSEDEVIEKAKELKHVVDKV